MPEPTMFVIRFPSEEAGKWDRFTTTLEPEQLAVVARLIATLSELAMTQKLLPMIERRVVEPDAAQPSLFPR